MCSRSNASEASKNRFEAGETGSRSEQEAATAQVRGEALSPASGAGMGKIEQIYNCLSVWLKETGIWKKSRFGSKNKDFILKQTEFVALKGKLEKKVQQS